MTTFHVVTMLLLISAIFSYINQRFLRLQSTIGLMLLAIIFALMVQSLHYFQLDLFHNYFQEFLAKINFSEFVLQGVLCFLLFAGALNVPLKTLAEEKKSVITLAIIGTLLTTFIIGSLCWLAFRVLGMPVSYVYTLIFGAIITPTDPIAALAILGDMGIPKKLEVLIDGESQFNDGVGVVIFVTLTGIAFGSTTPTISGTVFLFLQEVIGGVGLGLLVAAITHFLFRGVKDTGTQLLITLAAVTVNYAFAEVINVSGPIASVVLGMILGNVSLHANLDLKSQEHLKLFWEMANTALVSILFVLIGLEVLVIHLPKTPEIIMPLLAIVFVLIGRYTSISISGYLLDIQRKFNFSSRLKLTNLLTWTGLRGALAIALVMSLPAGEMRDLYLLMTYAVVVFSILVQGSTIKYFFSTQELNEIVNSNK